MPDDTVVPLKPTTILPARPNQGVVDILRRALDMALKGEIRHVSVSYMDDAGGDGGMYDGNGACLLAAHARLERRIHAWLDGQEK